MTKTIDWYTRVGGFSAAALARTETSQGHDFVRHEVSPWPWSGNQAFFFSKQMSDGTIIIPSQPQKFSAFSPTGDTLEFARFYPDTGALEREIIPTSTGVLHPKSLTLGGQVGGADFEDCAIYFVNGEERLIMSVGRNYNDWWIGAGPGGGVPGNQGIYPMHVVLRKTGGIWTYDATESRYPAQYLADNPTAAANIITATVTPVTGEAYTAVRQNVELGVFPASGHIVQAHYDDRAGAGFTSGAVTVVGDDGAGAGLKLKAGFLLPNVDWPAGNRIGVRARSPKPNPSSSLNNERFVLHNDVLGTTKPAGAYLDDATNTVITTPDSAAWQVAGVHRVVTWVMSQDYSAALEQILYGHWESVGNQRGWMLGLSTGGELIFRGSNNGTALTINVTTNTAANGNVSAGLVDGLGYWLGAEIDTITGTLKFYKAADAGTMPALWAGWTQIGTNVAAGAIVYHNSTASLAIGGTGSFFTGRFKGWVRRAALYDDGVLIANYDASPSGSPLATVGNGTYTDSTGKVWTHRGDARIHTTLLFDAVEMTYNAGAGTLAATSQPFWPAQAGQNTEQAQFDEVGNLWLSQVFSGLFNGQVAIYEQSGGTHSYNALAPSGAWTSGDGSLSLQWGRYYDPTTLAGVAIGATANGFTWDNVNKVMYYSVDTSGLLAIARRGGAAPYTYDWLGNLQIHSDDEPATHLYRPLIDHARSRVWLPIGQGYLGAYPPATPPDLAQWIVSMPMAYWLDEPSLVPIDFATWPVRTESVDWQVYDKDGNGIGMLMVATRDTPSITNDTTRSIRRNVSSITVLPRPMIDTDTSHIYAGDIDPLTMRVSPWWQFGDGLRYQMGVFLWGDDSEVLWSSGNPRSGMLTDLCTILDQPLPRSVGYQAGTSVNEAIADLLGLDPGGEVSAQVMDGISTTDAVIGVAVGWTAGRDTTLTALDALCKIAGFLPPYYDNQGRLICREAPDIASASAAFAYGAGVGAVIPGSATRSSDLLTAPNRYMAIGGNTDAELVGIFDVPDSAPNSYVNRGFRITKAQNVQGITTQVQADQAAAALYATDISSYTWLSFASARVQPQHDTWDVVSFDGVNFREVAWSIEAKPGGRMAHQLRGTYQ